MKFSIKDFFCKCDQIHRKLWIWSHLLKKLLMQNFIFCTVNTNLPILLNTRIIRYPMYNIKNKINLPLVFLINSRSFAPAFHTLLTTSFSLYPFLWSLYSTGYCSTFSHNRPEPTFKEKTKMKRKRSICSILCMLLLKNAFIKKSGKKLNITITSSFISLLFAKTLLQITLHVLICYFL